MKGRGLSTSEDPGDGAEILLRTLRHSLVIARREESCEEHCGKM